MGMGVRGALAMAGLLLGQTALAHAGRLTVKVQQGRIHGKTINGGKVKAFLGLPYAAPPVGELRWRAPEPPAKWKGARDATKFGAHCAQSHSFGDMIFQDGKASENCLFLNVYAPAWAKANSRLPVMFWIHGGGYVAGASSEPRHNGDFLPLKGVVLVTINYRLGVFGFLATRDLAREGDGASGNYGLMDMVAALRWVRANIGKFGGDPRNVTIFGESAGSFAVSTLMTVPEAQGLFQKAIGESGAPFANELPVSALAAREKSDGAWVASLGVPSLAELRALPTEKILAAAKEWSGMKFIPVVDGRFLPAQPSAIYAAGKQAHVPLLAGWNRDEGSFAAARGMTQEEWQAKAQRFYGKRAPEFLALYPGRTDAEALRSAIDYAGDNFIALGTWKWIEAQCRTGDEPVYRYHLELASPPSKFHPGHFAFHSDDIEYVFGTLDTRPDSAWRPEDRKLSEQMMSYWTNFAKTGDPNGPGLPKWPQFCKTDEVLHLNNPITAGPDPVRARYEFLLKNAPAAHF